MAVLSLAPRRRRRPLGLVIPVLGAALGVSACGGGDAADASTTLPTLPSTTTTDLAFSGVAELPQVTIIVPLPGATVTSPVAVEVELVAVDLVTDRLVVSVDGLPVGEFDTTAFEVAIPAGEHILQVGVRRGDTELNATELIAVTVEA